ncbi:MAG: hypothetical protein WCA16_01590, partial [Candidatus Sulfotelmatobacter sp.]
TIQRRAGARRFSVDFLPACKQVGLRSGPVEREILRPAGENAGLQDDVVVKEPNCTTTLRCSPGRH